MTIITGGNGMGKSCLIKSIYRTFGADCKINSRWEDENIITLIRFTVDSIRFEILRYGETNNYALFDSESQLIEVFDSVSLGIGLKLAEILDFQLLLNNRHGESQTPTSPYMFLPFYLDQDAPAWSETWSSFKKLGQFTQWRSALINYHTGIFPNEYYKTKAAYELANKEQRQMLSELKVLDNLIKSISDRLKIVDFNVDLSKFKIEVENLMLNCNDLFKSQQKIKNDLVVLSSERLLIEDQLKIAMQTKKELNSDFKFSASLPDEVECPTCGAHYTNNFRERFEIAQDEHKCDELIMELKEQKNEIDRKISVKVEKISLSTKESTEIEYLLNQKKEEVVLRDIIDNAGKQEMKKELEHQKQDYELKSFEISRRVLKLKENIKFYDSDERKEHITEYFRRMMRQNLNNLDLNEIQPPQYKNLDASLDETGSSQPRAILAYFYAILSTIQKFSDSLFAPIIIDSPNQNAQDGKHLKEMIHFIINSKIPDSQIIFATETLMDVVLPDDMEVIEFTDKGNLLSEDQYESVGLEITPYLNKFISGQSDQLFNEY